VLDSAARNGASISEHHLVWKVYWRALSLTRSAAATTCANFVDVGPAKSEEAVRHRKQVIPMANTRSRGSGKSPGARENDQPSYATL